MSVALSVMAAGALHILSAWRPRQSSDFMCRTSTDPLTGSEVGSGTSKACPFAFVLIGHTNATPNI